MLGSRFCIPCHDIISGNEEYALYAIKIVIGGTL